VTAIEQMSRVHRWACEEKRQTLDDFLRLAERLRADLLRLEVLTDEPAGATEARRRRLERSIAEVDQGIERTRQELALAEQEVARVEQMREGRDAVEKPPGKSQEKAAGRGRGAAMGGRTR
jgi:hypothetical protein